MENPSCPECGKSFDSQFALADHVQEHRREAFVNADSDLKKAKSKIKTAAIAGYISVGLTVFFAISGLFGFGAFALIDATIILGLSIGVHLNNRGCAVALFCVWILEKIFQLVQNPSSFTGLPVAIIFTIMFYMGITGTFAYHRLKKVETTGPLG